jgi:hypothetical protein
MKLTASTRKLLLTGHVVASIGWVGALAVFMAHAIASLTSHDPFVIRAACLAMALTAWFVILPLSLASLITGIVQALGTAWGLLRHYWVAFKLLLTFVATLVLLLKLGPIAQLADTAALSNFSAEDQTGLRVSLLVHAIGGLGILLCAAALAIFKPVGLLPTAARGSQSQSNQQGAGVSMPRWVKIFGSLLIAVVILLVLMLAGGEHGPAAHMHSHG